MAKTGSFIKLDRGIRNNPIWLEKPFSKGQAWVDLLIMAQWKDSSKKYNGKMKQFVHGNVYTSTYELANHWGWSRNKVYRFLEELLFAEMIEIKGWTSNGTNNGTINRTKNGTKDGTTITIVNWDVYQYTESNDGTNDETKKQTNNDQKTEHTIEYKNKKKGKRIYKGSLRSDSLPRTIEDIVPEVDLAGFPSFEDMPQIADGTKRDIPPRVRHLFDSQYDAYWRYMEKCNMS